MTEPTQTRTKVVVRKWRILDRSGSLARAHARSFIRPFAPSSKCYSLLVR